VPGADVEHQVAGTDAGVRHNVGGPAVSELMPSPVCPFRGHAAPW
jgi:hypothetical protein